MAVSKGMNNTMILGTSVSTSMNNGNEYKHEYELHMQRYSFTIQMKFRRDLHIRSLREISMRDLRLEAIMFLFYLLHYWCY